MSIGLTPVTCDYCGLQGSAKPSGVHPPDWVYVSGPEPFHRRDFCSWHCLMDWDGQPRSLSTLAKLLDVASTSG